MTSSELLANLLSPPVLCFGLGLLAARLRSDLEFPAALAKTMSLLLLFAIGLKGGVALAKSGWSPQVGTTLGIALVAAVVVPLWCYAVLKPRLGALHAAALAASYGSVSAVTFITATAYLEQRGIGFSGHLVAAMALMETPAIAMGLWLARRAGVGGGTATGPGHLWREALLNGSVVLLLGGLVIGLVCGPTRIGPVWPLAESLFPVILSVFLLELGLVAGRQWTHLRACGGWVTAFALVAPLVNALLGVGLARAVGLSVGDALLFTVLCASASYIAVPAALRTALPEANPAIYLTPALALTFPFNVVVGLPLYRAVIEWLWA